MYSLFGFGNPLLDFVTVGGFELIEQMNTRTGTMNLIDRGQMEQLLSRVETYKNIPGGCAANTARGIAWLNANKRVPAPVYSGAVGRDPIGQQYWESLQKAGVVTRLVEKQSLTGCSVIVVTPDKERTMFTFLGACREYREQDLDLDALKASRFVHLTGFMWDTENQRQAAAALVRNAQRSGISVSFDLADPFAVQRYRDAFWDWIPSRVNVLFGNLEELSLLLGYRSVDGRFGKSAHALVHEAGDLADTIMLKIGADGCLVKRGEDILHCAGVCVEAVDTTAAGDSFAAGYLFGVLNGWTESKSAALANRLAAGIVTVEGCDYDSLERSWVFEGVE